MLLLLLLVSTSWAQECGEVGSLWYPLIPVAEYNVSEGPYLDPTYFRQSAQGVELCGNGYPDDPVAAGCDYWKLHLGEDWNSDDGTDAGDLVLSIANGQVLEVGNSPTGFGNYVLVEHEWPTGPYPAIYSLYAHLQDVSVSSGECVTIHEELGTVGSTGFATGPHLHFEIRTDVRDTPGPGYAYHHEQDLLDRSTDPSLLISLFYDNPGSRGPPAATAPEPTDGDLIPELELCTDDRGTVGASDDLVLPCLQWDRPSRTTFHEIFLDGSYVGRVHGYNRRDPKERFWLSGQPTIGSHTWEVIPFSPWQAALNTPTWNFELSGQCVPTAGSRGPGQVSNACGLPPTVTTQAATGVTDAAATLNMTVNPNGLATEAWFAWDDDSFVDAFSTPRVAVGDGTSSVPHSWQISSLNCETTYYFQAKAESTADEVSGVVRSFTTDACDGDGEDAQELLTNGDFESGSAGWEAIGDFYIGTASRPRSGIWYAFLADPFWDPGDNLFGSIESDPVTIPGNATSVELSFWYRISTAETTVTTEFDKLHIWLLDPAGGVLHSYDNLSNLDDTGGSYVQWSQSVPSSLWGEDVELMFIGQTDESLPTVFRVDDVSLEATVPEGGEPSVVTDPADQIDDDSARLNLRVTANNAATEVWFEWDDDPNLSHETDAVSVGPDAVEEPIGIVLSNLDCEETYYFEAFAENIHGQDDGIQRSFTTDDCPGGPPTADTDPAEAITRDSARLTAEILPNGLPTDAWFAWGETGSLGQTTPRQGVGSGESWVDFDATLSGLACDTTYYFEAHAENSAGDDDGAVLSFTTDSCAPSNNPPVAYDDAYSTDEGTALDVPAPGVLENDTDAEGDLLTAVLGSGPANGTLTLDADGSFTYDPDPSFSGPDSFTYGANDGTASSNTGTVTITVNSLGGAPVADFSANVSSGNVPLTVTFADLSTNSPTQWLWQFGDGAVGREQNPVHTYTRTGVFTVRLFVSNADGTDALVRHALIRVEVQAAYQLPVELWLGGEMPDPVIGSAVPGDPPNTNFGFALEGADLNADGIDDVAMGAPFAEPVPGRANSGSVYLLYGSRGLHNSGRLELDGSQAPVTCLVGAGQEDWLGRSLAVGDFDGDGREDLLIGAENGDLPDRPNTGVAYVLYGMAGLEGIREIDLADPPPGVSITAIWGTSEYGFSASYLAAGDVDGDGLDDALIGAWQGDGNPALHNPGYVAVVYGDESLRTLAEVDLLASGVDSTLVFGSNSAEGFGRDLAVADVNGDGLSDLLVGAIGADAEDPCPEDPSGWSQGAAYLVYGSAGMRERQEMDLSVEAAGFTKVLGKSCGTWLGMGMGGGDLNGDGLGDAVLGSYLTGRGEAYVVLGAEQLPDVPVIDLNDVPGTEPVSVVRIYGDDNKFAQKISTGDINGDGLEDLLVGAQQGHDPQGNGTGQAFVLYGDEALGAAAEIDLTLIPPDDPAALTRVYGDASSSQLGSDVLSADLNNDHLSDLLVSDIWADDEAHGSSAGRLYVVYGGTGLFRRLSLIKLGNGEGTVVEPEAGIECGEACTSMWVEGTELSLSATADGGSSFAGWLGGACTGTGECSVILSQEDLTVGALFVEPGLCGHADRLEIHGLTLTTQELLQACSEVVLGPALRIEAPGDVRVRSGGGIALVDTVEVGPDAELALESDVADLAAPERRD